MKEGEPYRGTGSHDDLLEFIIDALLRDNIYSFAIIDNGLRFARPDARQCFQLSRRGCVDIDCPVAALA